jgi:hypothetical protein
MGALLRCVIPGRRSIISWMFRWSEGEREVVEGDAELVAAGGVGRDVAVAAAQVLHEGMTSGEHAHWAVIRRS